MTASVKVGKSFRVVLPTEFRDMHDLAEGAILSVQIQGDALVLVPLKQRQREIQARYAECSPEILSEFLAERRAEAARE